MASAAKFSIAFILVASFAAILSGCNFDDSSGASKSAPAASGGTSTALKISGSPTQSVVVGSAYSFHPTAAAAAGAALTFVISNKPAWASFDTATGTLSGTPGSANVGVDAKILIGVSDGAHSATLAAFSISITPKNAGSVTLYWTAPSLNSNGTLTTNLAGYRIYYGQSQTSMDRVITIADASNTSQVISDLLTGTWYFAVTAFNTEHVESRLSAVLPLTI